MNSKLNNRYQIIRVLGSGGFGDTFLAEDTQMPSGRRCVIKQLKPLHNKPEIYQLVQERFRREAAILEELGGGSTQIPQLYAYFLEAQRFYLVQEYIEGQTLREKLQQHGTMSESAVKEILIGILPILEYIHAKRIVHRDIKPDNIILRDRDGKPVLIDFGAVKETMGTTITVSDNSARSIVIGTPGFMPSEQSAGRPMYASDLYSLGLTAVYLLTGKLPQEISVDFATGELMWQQYALNVSPTFIAILDKAIHPSARDRYSTATEMLQALEAGTISTVVEKKTLVISTEDNIGQQPPTRMEPTTPRQIVSQGMREWQKAVVMGGVIGACVVGGLWFIDAKEQKKPVWTSVIPSSQNSNTANDIAPASENLDRLNTQTPTVKPKVESTLPASVNTSPPDLTPPPNQQPSPAQAVENYYSNINSGQYQTAWNQLSPEYQSNKRLHPNGYSSYLNWWGEKVASVNIEQLSVLEANQDTATVNASLKYLMKTGRIVPNSVRLSLIWDAQNLRWVVRDAK